MIYDIADPNIQTGCTVQQVAVNPIYNKEKNNAYP